VNTTDRLFDALLLGVGLAAAGVVVARAAPPGQVRAPMGVLHSAVQSGSPIMRADPRSLQSGSIPRAASRRPSQFSRGARHRRQLVFAQVLARAAELAQP